MLNDANCSGVTQKVKTPLEAAVQQHDHEEEEEEEEAAAPQGAQSFLIVDVSRTQSCNHGRARVPS